MNEVREFGIPWLIRRDVVPETTYKPENVTRYSQASPKAADGSALFPTTRRISLTSPNDSSALIATRDVLGFGTYEVLLMGRLDWFDPEVVVACYTHVDTPAVRPAGHVEADFEAAAWGDQNRRDRIMLGIYQDAKKPMLADGKPRYPDSLCGAPSFRYHKVTITQTPSMVRVVAAGWWDLNQQWKEYAWGEWAVMSPVMGRFKVSCWRKRPYLYPASGSGPSKIVVAGFKFTPG